MSTTTGRRSTRAERRPPGGAHALERVLDSNGTTVADTLVLAFRTGGWVEGAAGLAGVAASTVYDWLREGARIQADVVNGRAHEARMNKRDRLLYSFTVNTGVAIAEHESRLVARVGQLASGGLTRTRTKVRHEVRPGTGDDAPARLVTLEETVTEEMLPSLPANVWLLERRYGDRWGRREQLEITGAQGGPVRISSPLPRLLAQLEEMETRRKSVAAIIDTTATEAPPSDA